MRNKVYNTCRIAPVWFCLFLFISGCEDPSSASSDYVADVALYSEVDSLDASVIAAKCAIEFYGYSVGLIGIVEILDDKLDGFNVVLFPGGDTREIISTLGPVGRMKVKSFVASGGGFIGFGGGSAIADSNSGFWPGIGLFNGIADYPLNVIAVPPDYAITTIQLGNPFHPITRDNPSHYQTLYFGGPQFVNLEPDIDVLFNYAVTGNPAAIAFEYQRGRIFLAGFQPEIEEDDDRDSTDFGQELSDADSEWEMIKRAVEFCRWEI